MGLDMYLKGKRFLSGYSNENDKKIKAAVVALFPELKKLKGRFEEGAVDEISIDAGYWRKANQIHNWFVKNVQDGEDQCRSHYVSREQLQALKDVCQKVLENPNQAQSLLPTASGFFFGSTDYGEYYYSDLKHTINVVDTCLALPEEWSFEYRSSW